MTDRTTTSPAANPRLTWIICLVLAGITLFAYQGVFSAGFVDYDDPYYVVQNQMVQSGFTGDSLDWAFSSRDCDNWHPLTWLSLMLDDQIYGLNPAGFHATNLALHILNCLLVFLLLQRMTGARWRSAFVAALFALHPLHVESVAWIAERKDVLSTFFGLLTLMAYVRYAEEMSRAEGRASSLKPGVRSGNSQPSTLNYSLVLLFFAASLMAKPMLVTLPLLLLLLDFWPLRRMPPELNIFGRQIRIAETNTSTTSVQRSLKELVTEKMPLLALSLVSCVITVWAQTKALDMNFPLSSRWLNAALAYVRYLFKTVWPARLYVNYPYPNGWPVWYPLLALLILIVLSIWVVRQMRTRPYLLTGWFWFLIALVPVIGLVQVGIQSMADRYTYVPLLGVFILAVWFAADVMEQWRRPRSLRGSLALLVILGCLPLTMIQVGYWQNSFTLFNHALRLNPDNFMVQVNLAMSYEAKNEMEHAREHLVKATQINPYFGEIYNKLGWVDYSLGHYPDAVAAYQNALKYQGAPALAHYGLALAWEKQGRWPEATANIQAAMALEPGNQEDLDEYNLIQEKSRPSPETGGNNQPPRR